MSIKQNVERAKRDYDEAYVAGMEKGSESIETISNELEQTLYGIDTGGKSFYDVFWDTVQNYGNRRDYRYAFANWVCEELTPKYPLNINAQVDCMFLSCTARTFPDIDTSGCTSVVYLFANTIAERLPFIDMSKAINTDYAFYGAAAKTISIKCSETTPYKYIFHNCTHLENLTIEGTIGQNGLNLKYSPKLSKASIISIINALSDTTTGLTVTLSRTAVNKAFETSEGANDGSTSSEWTTLIGTRNNWTISLA